jgi:hypothetical protein
MERMMSTWKNKLLRVGIVIGGFLIGISLVNPGAQASFYEKLLGFILFLGCLGMRVHHGLWGSKTDRNDSSKDNEY